MEKAEYTKSSSKEGEAVRKLRRNRLEKGQKEKGMVTGRQEKA